MWIFLTEKLAMAIMGW